VLIHKATFNTPRWSFEAYGSTPPQALLALQIGWDEHARQTEADPNYLNEYRDDISVTTVEVGGCYRDGGERLC
jgi:hypothetical protein